MRPATREIQKTTRHKCDAVSSAFLVRVYDAKTPVRVVTAKRWHWRRALLFIRLFRLAWSDLKVLCEGKRVCRQQNAQLLARKIVSSEGLDNITKLQQCGVGQPQLRPTLVDGCLCRIGRFVPHVQPRHMRPSVLPERYSRNAITRECWSRGLNLQKARRD